MTKRINKKICAVILAAGASSRMGRPKALLKLEGKNFIEIIYGKLAAAGINDIYVVTGDASGDISDALNREKFKTIINRNWREGQLSSLKEAVRALPKECEGLLVSLVDNPQVSTGTVRRLLAEFSAGNADVIIPEYRERGGHPVIFASEVFGSLLDAPLSEGARGVLRSGRYNLLRIKVDDPYILQDIDTPEDYRKITNEF